MNKTNNAVSSFDTEVAHQLRDLVSQLNRKLKNRISNKDQLSISELNVIKLLFENEKVLPSEICSHFNLSSQYVSQVLNKLNDLGFINRKAVGDDKRKNFAVITSKGKKWLLNSRHEREEWLASVIVQLFTKPEKELILTAIQLLNKITE